MTAAIVGLTFIEAGPHTHVRRYDGGRAYWHCSTTNSECQGHGPAPTATTTTGGPWCPKGLHQGQMRPRSDKTGMTCRGCEAARERARRSPAFDGRKRAA